MPGSRLPDIAGGLLATPFDTHQCLKAERENPTTALLSEGT